MPDSVPAPAPASPSSSVPLKTAPKPLPALRLPLIAASTLAPPNAPPPMALTRVGSRGDGSAAEQLLPGVRVVQTWNLAPVSRSDAAPKQEDVAADTRLLALEAGDGTTVFMRADALSAQLARARPELIGADGAIDFAAFRDNAGVAGSASRGAGDWVWRQITHLVLDPDSITDLAKQKAAELLGGKVEDLAVAGASWAGAKALMWAIESQLAGPPGLYVWNGGPLAESDRCATDADPRLAALNTKTGLLFIHGTGSNTLGGFGEMAGTAAWPLLRAQFDNRIFGFEHRTFSESPIDNALALVGVLPAGARLCVITHSRGGLVGDLLCMATDPAAGGAGLSALIDDYRRDPRPDEVDAETADPALKSGREQAAAEEQAKLRTLAELLRVKGVRVERYVRVASPARGTALLSDNLELFLSGLLTLVRKFSAWSVGAVAGAVATPLAGQAAKAVADKALAFLSRVVLEIADKRLQPQMLPGIEAMLPEAPMGMLLGRATLRAEVRLALVAGDIVAGGMVQRIGVMFTDWMFFDRADNDLVVDTASMYGGLASLATSQPTSGGRPRAIFVQGVNVNHFRYFRDDTRSAGTPLPQAIQLWLSADDPAALPQWTPLALPELQARPQPAASRGDAPPTDVLVYVPGIMGSRIAANGDVIWLDPLDLARGQLSRIAIDSTEPVTAVDLVGLAYGKLADHLTATHQVIRHFYDWRLPIGKLAEDLAKVLEKALADHPKCNVRILAHSMGGLLVRGAFAARPAAAGQPGLWDKIVASGSGGRLVMMGTPNSGSHLFVQTLLGQSSTIRMLARADLRHNMQQVLDIVAGFPGAIHLLPAPGFVDAGGGGAAQGAVRDAGRDYFDRAVWDGLAAINNDFWFGHQIGGRPSQTVLDNARAFWVSVADTSWVRQHPDRVAYVYGKADNTPCGLLEQSGVTMLGTPEGDGSVSWASGRLPGLPDERCWMMPVDHMGLTSSADYFGEIDALLQKGEPLRLGRLTLSRGDGDVPLRRYKAGPPPSYPNEVELASLLLGSSGQPLSVARRSGAALKVSVHAMDVRFAQIPVICGHYVGDPIAGAESLIDENLVNRALRRRKELNIHAGPLGSASIVLMPRSAEDIALRMGKGAVVVGLGEMGRLSADNVADAVRAGVLRFLMLASDRNDEELLRAPFGAPGANLPPRHDLMLASLLIGSNSAAQLSVEESVKAVVLGVLRANREFAEGAHERGKAAAVPAVQVGELRLVEVYRDSAISAAHAVAELKASLETDLRKLEVEVEPAVELRYGKGVRQRLTVSMASDYWPRIIACDADREESDCGPECYDVRPRHSIPPDALRKILRLYGCGNGDKGGAPPVPTGLDAESVPRYAERFKFVYLGEKARAETVVRQRQPGLVEKLVDDNFQGFNNTVYSAESHFGNTLFQLLVPLEFKSAARKSSNLILVVDEATANLPWEMLEADGQPLVLKTRMVRQMLSPRFRREVTASERMTACVIANPSTAGFHAQFGWPEGRPSVGADGKPEEDRLPSLSGAAQEGDAVAGLLEGAGYAVARVLPEATAATVFSQLFARSHRVLVVAAHGIFSKRGADGVFRSGVVLSNGLLLSAAEIELMENVPDIVFLSCCHLGKMGGHSGASHRLAYSLASQLIEIGVRCVIAAGWEVADDAARTFSETFFDRMLNHSASFADAVFDARKKTAGDHPGCNTWGAYQAYGDPQFRLEVGERPADGDRPMLAPEELLSWLDGLRASALRGGGSGGTAAVEPTAAALKPVTESIQRRLRTLPPAWAGRPDVLHAIGTLYAEFGEAGFDTARSALLRAIAEESKTGLVPLAAIEQLANFEARTASALGDSDDSAARAEALQRIKIAVTRLDLLIRLSSGDLRPDADADPEFDASVHADSDALPVKVSVVNPERWALLGSAYKRGAVIKARDPASTWAEVGKWLRKARDAYRAGEAGGASYLLFNRLQLDALLGEPLDNAGAARVVEEQAAAAQRFASTYSLWDAVAAGDGDLALWLFQTGAPADGAQAALQARYERALRVVASAREFDSVTQQLHLMAASLRKRALDAGAKVSGDELRAQVLESVAQALSGGGAASNVNPATGGGLANGTGAGKAAPPAVDAAAKLAPVSADSAATPAPAAKAAPAVKVAPAAKPARKRKPKKPS